MKLDKCSKSPTGGHHWKIEPVGKESIGICKYCKQRRKFTNIFGGQRIDPGLSSNYQ